MLMIFPASELTGALHAHIQAYRLEYKNNLIHRDLTEEECRDLVFAAANDFLNTRLLWLKTPPHNELLNKALTVHFQEWEYEKDCKQSEHFYRLVLDDTIVKIEQLMDLAIPEHSWKIWYVKQVGPDIIFEEGTDYRVMDWTRRMESGEWEQDTTKLPVNETSKMLDQVSQVILKDLIKSDARRSRPRPQIQLG